MKKTLFLASLLITQVLWANIELPALFSDGMILQQKAKVPIWGWAAKGTHVSVIFNNQTKSTTVDDDGKWMLHLDPLKASAESSELKITVGPESKTIQNVLVGEVWLCSGQSNMDYTMQALTGPAINKKNQPIVDSIRKEIAEAKDPLFRQITAEYRNSHFKELESFKGRWVESSPQNNGSFTATGYYFGRQLRRELKVPVALIKCAWGGTIIEPWISKQSYLDNAEITKHYEDKTMYIKQKLNQWDEDKVQAAYRESIRKWEKNKKEAIAQNKPIPHKPQMPKHPDSFNWAPSTLYNGMIHPLLPYGIKGVIWYQGESNGWHVSQKSELYGKYFECLISGWRKAWKQGDFPFYYAQLANWSEVLPNPVDKVAWTTVCNQQRLTLKVKNTGMAVLHDIGEAEDLHPKNKIDVGKRLALWALAKDYGRNIVYSGPLYKSSVFNGSRVTITFSSVGQGLMTGRKTLLEKAVEVQIPLSGFQICGADRSWNWAQAKIINKNQVEVFCPEVKVPVEVRYAWAKNAQGSNLYNKEGLPASVFKTINKKPGDQ